MSQFASYPRVRYVSSYHGSNGWGATLWEASKVEDRHFTAHDLIAHSDGHDTREQAERAVSEPHQQGTSK